MSGGLLAIVPVIWDQTADKSIPSMTAENSAFGVPRDEILLVDNSRDGFASKPASKGPHGISERYGLRVHRDPDGHNLGVAGAWNVGAREVLERGLDYLVIVSTTMLFGPILHTTWRRQMETFWGERVIECDGHSWHLIAFHREVFERIGLFDTNYHPAYIEGLDWSFRMRQVGWEGGWRHVWVNAMSMGQAMHVDLVSCPAGPLLDYYAAKWGGCKGEETFVLPWGDKPLDYFEQTPIPVLAERYGLENWW